ncbi:MAG: heme ABC transporter ATP-binding protein [Pseudomonadota bacterium]
MIIAENLSVNIGNKPIINNISYSLFEGEFLAVIGPNGSGKTTMMKALSGELEYAGKLQINGQEIISAKAIELARMRAVLSQFTQVTFPFLVREIVSFGVIAGGVSQPDRENLPEKALEEVGLKGFEERKYQELSGGEQQRVQLARVLCQVWQPVTNGQAHWLFLDEPVSSLDLQHQINVMKIAKSFSQRGGGVVAILHDLNLTAMYADQVLLLKDGSIVDFGTPKEVLQDQNLQLAYDCHLKVGKVPQKNGKQFVLPQSLEL